MAGAGKSSPAYSHWASDSYFLSLDMPDNAMVNVETAKKEHRTNPSVRMHFQEFVRVYNSTDQYMVDSVPELLQYVSWLNTGSVSMVIG